MLNYLLDLGTSDVCSGWPGAGPYAWRQLAHAAMGGVAALAPVPMQLVLLTAWIGKEILSDPQGCNLVAWVAIDSVADILFGVVGFVLMTWVNRERLYRE